jgi:heme exporter protein C
MIQFLRQQWWKYISAIILLYVIAGGMLVPLGPGLTDVVPMTFSSGHPQLFNVQGYHTHFKAADFQLWFKNGANYYCPQLTHVIDDTHLDAVLMLSAGDSDKLQGGSMDIVINDAYDGTVVLRDATTLTRAGAIAGDGASHLQLCVPEVVHSRFEHFAFPYREILYQTIRNTFYHVPMWFSMLFILLVSTYYSIKYLNTGRIEDDILASQAVHVALLFGALGLATGMMWATYTWGEPWPNDPKLNGAAVGVIIYLAYIVLRGSVSDEIKRAKISAAYNIFAIVIFILFIFVIPRLTDSLHPGNGGNPAFSKYDLDSHLRMFFYPAVIGWILFSMWIWSIRVRTQLLLQYKSML